VLVDDFDLDGTDDLLAGQGVMLQGDTCVSTEDVLFLQRARDSSGPAFVAADASAGFGRSPAAEEGMRYPCYATRGAVRFDADLDGHLDVLLAGLEGSVRWHTEQTGSARGPRCTLRPEAFAVPTSGFGVEVRPAGDDGPWRRYEHTGQYLSTGPPWVIAPFPQGELRFASGAVVPFDCGDGHGPLSIAEPAWLTMRAASDAKPAVATVDLRGFDPPVATLALVAETGPERTRSACRAVGNARWACTLPNHATRFMLAPDARHIPRWWSAPSR
jgi:hypothetical protein